MSENVTSLSNSSVMTLNRTACIDLEQVGTCCETQPGSESSSLKSKWLYFLIAGVVVSHYILFAFILVEILDLNDMSSTSALTYGNVTLPLFSSSYLIPRDSFVRDLTRYGIEPNPGPPKGGTKVTVSVRAPKKGPAKRGKLPTVHTMRGIKGHGGYGEDIGRKLGGWIGDKAQSFIQSITGFGDYTVRSNTLVNGGSPPQFAAGSHCSKLCHREFVGLVSSPGPNFTITPYPINPKSPFFPWLSEIALSFEQYRIRGMVVEFKTTSATAVSSTNTALGSVIIATQYNVLAPPFSTQQQMEAYQFCTSCAPSLSMIHPIECDPMQNSVSELYIDSSSGDPRLEYLGTTYVATVGQQAASVIGELWVSYEIDLMRPKLFSGVANLGLSALYSALFTGSLPLIGQVGSDFFASFRRGYSAFALGGTNLPYIGSDLPLSFPPLPAGLASTGGFGLIEVPGWVSGVLQFTLVILTPGNINNLSEVLTPTVSILQGNADTNLPYNSAVAIPIPTYSASGNYGGNMGFTFYVHCAGNQVNTPVQILVNPWETYGNMNQVTGVTLVATGMAIGYPNV